MNESDMSLGNTSMTMSDYRGFGGGGHDSSMATYSEADVAELLHRVDHDIVETFSEFNTDLEKSL
jgi:hypothetical protein